MKGIQLRQIKIATSGVHANCYSQLQIAYSEEELLWDVDNNSINYCSKDLKKLPDVI